MIFREAAGSSLGLSRLVLARINLQRAQPRSADLCKVLAFEELDPITDSSGASHFVQCVDSNVTTRLEFGKEVLASITK